LGFCWQFITLAGFHCDALSIDLFAKAQQGTLADGDMSWDTFTYWIGD
jgi:isocitrate lyase